MRRRSGHMRALWLGLFLSVIKPTTAKGKRSAAILSRTPRIPHIIATTRHASQHMLDNMAVNTVRPGGIV